MDQIKTYIRLWDEAKEKYSGNDRINVALRSSKLKKSSFISVFHSCLTIRSSNCQHVHDEFTDSICIDLSWVRSYSSDRSKNDGQSSSVEHSRITHYLQLYHGYSFWLSVLRSETSRNFL